MGDPKQEFRKQALDLAEGYEHHGCALISEAWGLCASCAQFNFALTAGDNEKAHCGYTETMRQWPSRNDPIKECVRYEMRGKLTLHEMANMALYIDDKKHRLGF